MLSRDQAISLARGLGLDPGTGADPYAQLAALKIGKGSRLEADLYRILGVPYEDYATPSLEMTARETISPAYSLFPHQLQAAAWTRTALDEGQRRTVLHMPTGSGKTRTAMNIICDYLRGHDPRMAVWLAYSEELCDQAASEFETAWGALGNRSLTLFRFWGKNRIELGDTNDGLVVCGLDKMRASIKSNYQTWSRLADRAQLVIIDEAHQALAPTYKQTLGLLVDRHADTALLGLTATPGRTWNDLDEDQQLSNFFANSKVTLYVPGYENPVDYLVDEGYLARTNFESLTYSGGFELSEEDLREIEEATDIPTAVLEQIADDDARTLRILTRAESLSRSHRRLIVFATTARHSDTLAAVLTARGISAASITSRTHPSERRRIINEFRSNDEGHRILCNFGVLTTGFDAPQTSAAIIARPTKSLVLYSQMVGRATRGRRAGGNDEALIVTVVDTSLPGFGDMSEAFTNWEDVWNDKRHEI